MIGPQGAIPCGPLCVFKDVGALYNDILQQGSCGCLLGDDVAGFNRLKRYLAMASGCACFVI